jgi:hypothetical protein
MTGDREVVVNQVQIDRPGRRVSLLEHFTAIVGKPPLGSNRASPWQPGDRRSPVSARDNSLESLMKRAAYFSTLRVREFQSQHPTAALSEVGSAYRLDCCSLAGGTY